MSKATHGVLAAKLTLTNETQVIRDPGSLAAPGRIYRAEYLSGPTLGPATLNIP